MISADDIGVMRAADLRQVAEDLAYSALILILGAVVLLERFNAAQGASSTAINHFTIRHFFETVCQPVK